MSSKSTLVPFGTGVGVALRLLSTPISPSNRVREPVKPTTGRVVGYFPSVKNNRSIAWESQLEQKACYVFEFSPEIIKYREQPLSIYYRLNGELLRYTPDFELTLLSGELIYVEVKPGAKLQTQELQEKLGAISRYWKEKGLQFLIITDQELDHPILQSNLKLLRSYLRVKCDAELVQISAHWLKQQDNPTLGDLTHYLDSINKVYSLLAHQFLLTNLHEKIQYESNIYLQEENRYENQFFSCGFVSDTE